jgi:hypothetical protein
LASTLLLGTTESTNTGIISLTHSADDTKTVVLTGKNGIVISSDNDGNISVDAEELHDNIVGSATQSWDGNGGLTTTIKNKRNADLAKTTFTPKIQYGKDAIVANFSATTNTDNAEAIATLEVYTQDEVDTLLNQHFDSFNAMHYIDLVSSLLPTETEPEEGSVVQSASMKIGDTYKVD